MIILLSETFPNASLVARKKHDVFSWEVCASSSKLLIFSIPLLVDNCGIWGASTKVVLSGDDE
jgi:hypothetical protein